jgi:DNA-binding GntR family transcriptional regulator
METPVTTSERVYTELRRMVQNGDLAPGERLVQRKLAARMDVSSIPVIEATRRLQHDGLVVSHPNWGAQVRHWTEADIEGAYLAREALEGISSRLFAERANGEERARLVALAKRFDEEVTAERADGWLEADIVLHRHIVQATKSQALAHILDSSLLISQTMSNSHKRHRDGQPIVPMVGVHDELVAALLGNQPDVAEQVARAHVRRAYERMRAVNAEQVPSMNSQPASDCPIEA